VNAPITASVQPTELAAFSCEGGVGRIVMHRPPVNALDDALVAALDRAVDQAIEAEVAVLVLASGNRAFCAGADLKMVHSRTGHAEGVAQMEVSVRSMHRLFDRVAELPCVTIAEIDGVALGGGLELALACDLRLAGEDALLGLPEPAVGLLPGAGGTQRLTRLCGAGMANRIILAGDRITGADAAAQGLVQWACPSSELPRRTNELARRIASFSPAAIIESKRCIALAAMPGRGGAEAEIAAIRKLMTNPDSAARIAAFAAR